MSRAYLFIETGEVRKAHNEWRLEDGDCLHSIHTDMDYPILTRHEIEIPDDATILHCWPGDVRSSEILHFPIPRPKVKVKKTVEVSLYKDASARWKIPASIDTDKLPNYLGTFTVEIEVEE